MYDSKYDTGAILNSGGMDSYFVAREVPQASHVFVDIRQKYVRKERESALAVAKHFCRPLRVTTGACMGHLEHESGIIPLRNAELILCAAQYSNDVYLGILENEVNSDKSPEFLRAMETAMTISCRPQYWSEGRAFRIHTPLGRRSKVDLLTQLLHDCRGDLEHPDWMACLATVSCYSAEAGHCGRCPSCFKRWVALACATRTTDHADSFNAHPAEWYPLSHWRAKGYESKRMGEIERAYDVAYNV